ncbi:cAMP-dependent protein kinase [Toxoplasma gondii p89]|uniref:non-specific serine/threonine protein kinase n=1 Tax=Toxoplasma gondii p89 TaxID=943119 RepID=A0A086KA92_TOXGO|nr:cAMP-dependent protein kinase [Toxoplasma gondii p89]
MEHDDDSEWLAFCMKVEEQELSASPWCFSSEVVSPATPVLLRNATTEAEPTLETLSACSPKNCLRVQTEQGSTSDTVKRFASKVLHTCHKRGPGLITEPICTVSQEEQETLRPAKTAADTTPEKQHGDKFREVPLEIIKGRSIKSEHSSEPGDPNSDKLEVSVGEKSASDSTTECRIKPPATRGARSAPTSYASVFPVAIGGRTPLTCVSGQSPEPVPSRTTNSHEPVCRFPTRQNGDDGRAECPEASNDLFESNLANEEQATNTRLICEPMGVGGLRCRERLFDFTKPRGQAERAGGWGGRRTSRGSIREGVGATQIGRKLRLFAEFVTERKKKDEERVERQKTVRAILNIAARMSERRRPTRGDSEESNTQKWASVQEMSDAAEPEHFWMDKDMQSGCSTPASAAASALPQGNSLVTEMPENLQRRNNVGAPKQPRNLRLNPSDEGGSKPLRYETNLDLLSRTRTAEKRHADEDRNSLLRKYLSALEAAQTAWLRAQRERLDTQRFRVLAVLGVGAYGLVRLVQDRQTGEKFALKQMEKRAVKMKNERTRLYAERHVLAEVVSRHIVKLVCTFQDMRYLYQVLEYLPGGDLMTHLVACGRFSEETTKFYIAQLILAVHTVHRLGYLHRDIKPCNIVLDDKGNLKLLDFGLCAYYHSPCDFSSSGSTTHSEFSDTGSTGTLDPRLAARGSEKTQSKQSAEFVVYGQRSKKGVEKTFSLQASAVSWKLRPPRPLHDEIVEGVTSCSAGAPEEPNELEEKQEQRGGLIASSFADNNHASTSAILASTPASPLSSHLAASPNCCHSKELAPPAPASSASPTSEFVFHSPPILSPASHTSRSCARAFPEIQSCAYESRRADAKELVGEELAPDAGSTSEKIPPCDGSEGRPSEGSLILPPSPGVPLEGKDIPETPIDRDQTLPSRSITASTQETSFNLYCGTSLCQATPPDNSLSGVSSVPFSTTSNPFFLHSATQQPPSALSPNQQAVPQNVVRPAGFQAPAPAVTSFVSPGQSSPTFDLSASSVFETPSAARVVGSEANWKEDETPPLSNISSEFSSDLSSDVQHRGMSASELGSPLRPCASSGASAASCPHVSPVSPLSFTPCYSGPASPPLSVTPSSPRLQTPSSPRCDSLATPDASAFSFPRLSRALAVPTPETIHGSPSAEKRSTPVEPKAPTDGGEHCHDALNETAPSPAPSTLSPASSPTHISRLEALSQVGTPHYMAPEVLAGLPYSFPADWWSVGVILFECIYGGVPFNTPSYNPQLLSYIIINFRRFLTLPKHSGPEKVRVSAACRDVIQGLLCEPEQRWGFEELRQSAWLRNIDWEALGRGVWRNRERRTHKGSDGANSGGEKPTGDSERMISMEKTNAAQAEGAAAEVDKVRIKQSSQGNPTLADPRDEPSLQDTTEGGISAPQNEQGTNTSRETDSRIETTDFKRSSREEIPGIINGIAPAARGHQAVLRYSSNEKSKREHIPWDNERGCVAAEEVEEEDVTEGPLKLPSNAVPVGLSPAAFFNNGDRESPSRVLPSWCRYTPAMAGRLDGLPAKGPQNATTGAQNAAQPLEATRFGVEHGTRRRPTARTQNLRTDSAESNPGREPREAIKQPATARRQRNPSNDQAAGEHFGEELKSALCLKDECSKTVFCTVKAGGPGTKRAVLNKDGKPRNENLRATPPWGSHASTDANDWLKLQPFRPKDEVLKDLRFLNFTFKREEKDYEAGVWALEEKIRQIVMSDCETVCRDGELGT